MLESDVCELNFLIFYTSETTVTRIPSGVWSHLYGSFPPALNTYRASSQQCARGTLSTHGQKFDHESLYELIKFETLNPYLVNKY